MSLNQPQSVSKLSFPSRAELEKTPPLLQYLLTLISIKRSNLAVSADVHSTQDLLKLAEDVGDYICIFKTHADIIDDWSKDTIKALQAISKRKHFLLFEDRKFGDIGNTLELQYTRGPLQIATWAHLTNAHLLPGPGIVRALHSAAQETLTSMNQSVTTTITTGTPRRSLERSTEAATQGKNPAVAANDSVVLVEPHSSSGATPGLNGGQNEPLFSHTRSLSGSLSATTTVSQCYEQISSPRSSSLMKRLSHSEEGQQDIQTTLSELGPPPHARGLLLLAEMSSVGNLITPEYTDACVQAAQSNTDFVLGFICQRSLNAQPQDNFICLTPGVSLPPEDEEDVKIAGDGKGQRWRDPAEVVGQDGADIIIVGRGILKADNRRREAQRYQKSAWQAYERRISQS